ncbi:MAG TPA: SDR family NAD(P)-dependent oxidoreductase, partial [Methanofollis liminatans]|nr:SDR family NAD(P)-dependent oxidoreductase [Methanofollis liminatans]
MDVGSSTIFLTGAGGFIGSHLTEYLVEQNATVKALVKYTSRSDRGMLELLPAETMRSVEVIPGDLKDGDAIRRATRDADAIVHLGSIISVPYSYLSPRETIETNIIGTLNVLQAARENGVGRVVHTSTSEVYGTARSVPIDESHPLQGQSPYSASKIGADKIAESFFCSFDLPVVTIRPFNTYGPRQSARAVIPTIITQALTGKEVRLGALGSTRDFTYVGDLVRAFALALALAAPGVVGETINVGSNFEISVRDLAERILSLCGSDAAIVTEPV